MVTQPPDLSVKERLQDGARQLRYLPWALRLVHDAAGRWMWSWLVLLLLQGALPVATVLLTRSLVDSVVAAAGAGMQWAVLRTPVLLALAMGGVLVLGEIFKAVTGWVRSAQSELISDHVRTLIQDRAARVDLAFYESPDYYDMLHRARADAISRPMSLVENLGLLLQSTLTLLAMSAILLSYGWWLPFVLAFSTIPALAVALRHLVLQHQWSVRTTADHRRTLYYDQILTARESFPEVRLFNLADHFRELFRFLRTRLRTESLDLARRGARAQIMAGLLALLMLALTLVWMLVRVARGLTTLGGLAMFYQALSQGQGLMRTLLNTIGQLYGNSLFLGNLHEFLAVEPRITEPAEPLPVPSPIRSGLTFRGVSFTYPSGTHPVLRDFNLHIPAGRVVALLGRSGAGKSTLFRLLCRFYDPDQGAVELDGTDLRRFRQAELRRRIAVLFQEPVHFSASLRRNIAYGDLEREHADTLVQAAHDAGASEIVSGLPDGLETLLGPWFGGTELSVGEWQRVALARCYLRDADIVLLDEPTSAMDSWSEADWIDRFLALVKGRTAVLITHRLTTAVRADRIFVLDDGAVVEEGSHHELLALGGRYARAWASQWPGDLKDLPDHLWQPAASTHDDTPSE
jgi:ATP-binding cassette, subfamily B, bacterial